MVVVIEVNRGRAVLFLTFVAGCDALAPVSLSISYLASQTE